MTSDSIIADPVSQDLFSFVLLDFQVVWLTLDGMRPDELAVIVQNSDGRVWHTEATRSEEDVIVVITLRRVDSFSHGRRSDVGRAVRLEGV